MYLYRLLVLAALALAATADAQPVLTPDSPDLAVEEVALDDVYRLIYIDGRNSGSSVARAEVEGDVLTLVTVTAVDGTPRSDRTIRLAWPSLRPIDSRDVSGDEIDEVSFDGARVTGQFATGDGASTPLDLTLDQAPFPYGAIEWIARSLPFEEGYAVAVPTFTAEDRLRDYTLTVVGTDSTTLSDGTVVVAWAVDQAPVRPGSVSRRIYVDPDTRDLVAIRPQTSVADMLVEVVTPEAFAAWEASRQAGQPLRPGSDLLATEVLQSGRRTFDLTIAEPEILAGNEVATITLDWTIPDGPGEATLTGRAESNTGQVTIQTAVLAYPSLRPIREVDVADGDSTVWAYSDGGVTETTADSTVTREFESPVFGTSGSVLLEVARLLPLKEGLQLTYQMDSKEGPVGVQMTVEGPSEVEGRSVWTVSAAIPTGPVRVAFDPETREIVRTEFRAQPPIVIHSTPREE